MRGVENAQTGGNPPSAHGAIIKNGWKEKDTKGRSEKDRRKDRRKKEERRKYRRKKDRKTERVEEKQREIKLSFTSGAQRSLPPLPPSAPHLDGKAIGLLNVPADEVKDVSLCVPPPDFLISLQPAFPLSPPPSESLARGFSFPAAATVQLSADLE